MKKVWPFSFNFFFFAGVAFVAPYMVLFYQDLGFSGAQIGLLTGLAPLITLLGAPLWTGLADRTGRHKLIMGFVLLAAVASLIIFPRLRLFAPVLLFAGLFNLFFAPVSSFADSATMAMLGAQKKLYGRIRLGGTIGFGLVAPIAGVLVQNYALKFAFWGGAVLFFLALLASQKMTYTAVSEGTSILRGIRTLLVSRRWVLFLILAFGGGMAVAASNNYFFPYMKELGANETTMGLALTIGTLGEVPIFYFGNRLISRFNTYGLLLFSMVATGIRLILLGVTSLPPLVLFIQLLGGLTFPVMWLAGVSYADEYAPQGMQATAQGLFGAMVFGFGTAVGGFMGGPLLENLGGRSLFFVFGVVVLAATAIVILFSRPLLEKPRPVRSGL